MKVLVLNGSPLGEDSITLQTLLYIEKHNPEDVFEVLHVSKQIKRLEKDFSACREQLEQADLILFCYPVYTFLAPAQLHRFIELIKDEGPDLSGKYVSQITTSKHFYDMTAHQFIRDNCDDLKMRSIRGLTADMEDLLSKEGQKQALDFYRYVKWCIRNEIHEPTRLCENRDHKLIKAGEPDKNIRTGSGNRISLVTEIQAEGSELLEAMIERFVKSYPGEVTIVDLGQFHFQGGCLGCFHCASDGTCIYKDGFSELLRETIQTADAVVYAFSIRDHSMGSRFKMFDDRQFCNGHRTVTMGKPVGYLVDGYLEPEYNLMTLMEARAQVGGNFLAGIACDERDPDGETDRLIVSLDYAIRHNYQQPGNFYAVGGMKIFRDLIYQMQGLMKEDHRFYKKHGFYDFPQKKKGRVLGMYLVGALMENEKLSRKMKSKMTEGMLMPYKSVLRRKPSRRSGRSSLLTIITATTARSL